MMETETIDKTCTLCGNEAKGKIKRDTRSIELCHDCAKDVLWELIHNEYAFDKED